MWLIKINYSYVNLVSDKCALRYLWIKIFEVCSAAAFSVCLFCVSLWWLCDCIAFNKFDWSHSFTLTLSLCHSLCLSLLWPKIDTVEVIILCISHTFVYFFFFIFSPRFAEPKLASVCAYVSPSSKIEMRETPNLKRERDRKREKIIHILRSETMFKERKQHWN